MAGVGGAVSDSELPEPGCVPQCQSPALWLWASYFLQAPVFPLVKCELSPGLMGTTDHKYHNTTLRTIVRTNCHGLTHTEPFFVTAC